MVVSLRSRRRQACEQRLICTVLGCGTLVMQLLALKPRGPFEEEDDMCLDQLFRKSHIVDASHLMSCV